MAETPASTARRASSTRITPLSMNGPSHCSRSQRRSSQLGGGVTSIRRRRRRTCGAARRGRATLGTVRSGGRRLAKLQSQPRPGERLRGEPQHRAQVHLLGDLWAAPVAAVRERPVERDDQPDRAGGARALDPLARSLARAGPVELEEHLAGWPRRPPRSACSRTSSVPSRCRARPPRARPPPRRRDGPTARRSARSGPAARSPAPSPLWSCHASAAAPRRAARSRAR